jgi:hypothetical protein
MSRNRTTYIIGTPDGQHLHAEFRWTVSRGRDTYGYNICTLYIDGRKVANCDGGGYDMQGTDMGNWLAVHAAKCLVKLTKEFYGLTFHDPNYDPGKAVIGQDASDRTLGGKSDGKTVEQAERDGESLGLERYQAAYAASSKLPTERHTIPIINGSCGMSCVQDIGRACGYTFKCVN